MHFDVNLSIPVDEYAVKNIRQVARSFIPVFESIGQVKFNEGFKVGKNTWMSFVKIQ